MRGSGTNEKPFITDTENPLMFPDKFTQRVRSQEYIDAEGLFASLDGPPPVTIRINRAKWSSSPEEPVPVPWCSDGFYLHKRPSFTLDPLFHAGCYYPQEASGMFVEKLFRQTLNSAKNIRVLDLCGAPGGKSTHLASLIGQNGFLVANEVIGSRVSVLAQNITKWGLSNSIVTRNDPVAFGRAPGFFDMILVDAPCSGEGMFRDRAVVREWSPENTALCSERQKRILMDVWPALKEGGLMIYITCTFNPGENEKNIKWLVRNKQCEPVRLDISEYEGITEIDYEGIYGYGFYPGLIKGDGLFISVMRKTGICDKQNNRSKTDRKPKITGDEKRIACEWTGFRECSLLRTGDNLISIPCSYDDYLFLSGILRIVRAGTGICTVKAKNFLPVHEIAMSVYFKGESFPSVDSGIFQALTYLRRGHLVMNNAKKGWNTVYYNGIPLGFINNIGSRINNYYPQGWRIRMDITEQSNLNIIKWDNE